MASLCAICGGPTSVGVHPSSSCERVYARRLAQAAVDAEMEVILRNIWSTPPFADLPASLMRRYSEMRLVLQ